MAAVAVPDQKTMQYDRQLRVWGEHGQAALESARILLINASATGTETLKNLVLPGIGSFVILDGNKVTGADVGGNFFLTPESIGKSRAAEAHVYLKELNPYVEGFYNDENPSKVIRETPEYFHQFSVVVATDLGEDDLLALGAVLWAVDIPLLVARSIGFLGYLRLVTREHAVIESKPDNPYEDIRITEPFPALKDLALSIDLKSLPDGEFKHVPYPLLLIQYLESWRAAHGGKVPSGKVERAEFQKLLTDGCFGDLDHFDNFREAVAKIFRAYNALSLPSEARDVFANPRLNALSGSSPSFWIIARAVREFMEANGGLPPLNGAIPDMTSTSARYVEIQNVYKKKADDDFADVMGRVHELLSTLNPSPTTRVTEEEVRRFCRNVFNVRSLTGRSLADEYGAESAQKNQLSGWLEANPDTAPWYVVLRAVDRFAKARGRMPGATDDTVESDFALVKEEVVKVMAEWGITGNVPDAVIGEMCRYAGSELHSVAAFIGGVASQELVKVLTHQFVLVDNTFVFNGVKSAASVFKL